MLLGRGICLMSDIMRRFQKRSGLHCGADDKVDKLKYLLLDGALLGPRTRRKYKNLFIKKYPEFAFMVDEEEVCNYRIVYQYKNMEDCTQGEKDKRFATNLFKVTVRYKVYDENGNKILSCKKRRLYCEFNPTFPQKGEVDLFKGLTYEDLSWDVKEQIMLEKLKELIEIDLKLKESKWSTLKEISIEISKKGD